MKLKLKLEAMKDAPRADGGKSSLPALGWSENGILHIVRGWSWFFGYGRVAHEAEHQLTGLGNEMHDGHTWHFCGRAWHALRINPVRHISMGARMAAEELHRDGQELDVDLDGTVRRAKVTLNV